MAWGTSRSAVLSRDELSSSPCMYPLPVQQQLAIRLSLWVVLNMLNLAVLNSFLGGCKSFPLAHLSEFLWVYALNVQLLCWFIGVSVNCWTRSCMKWSAFGKGKIMFSLREAAQMFFMSTQKRGVCILLSNWQKPCIWKSLAFFFFYGLHDEAVNLKEQHLWLIMTFADLQNTGIICWIVLRSDGVQMLTINTSVCFLEHRNGNENGH